MRKLDRGPPSPDTGVNQELWFHMSGPGKTDNGGEAVPAQRKKLRPHRRPRGSGRHFDVVRGRVLSVRAIAPKSTEERRKNGRSTAVKSRCVQPVQERKDEWGKLRDLIELKDCKNQPSAENLLRRNPQMVRAEKNANWEESNWSGGRKDLPRKIKRRCRKPPKEIVGTQSTGHESRRKIRVSTFKGVLH